VDATKRRTLHNAQSSLTVYASAVYHCRAPCAVDARGYVYVADTYNNCIRKISPADATNVLPCNDARRQAYTVTDAISTWRIFAVGAPCSIGVAQLQGAIMTPSLTANHTTGWNPTLAVLNLTGAVSTNICTTGLFAPELKRGPTSLMLPPLNEIPPAALASPSLLSLAFLSNGALRLHTNSFAGLPSLSCINCDPSQTNMANLTGLGIFTRAPHVFEVDVLFPLVNMARVDLRYNGIAAFESGWTNEVLPQLAILGLCDGNSGCFNLSFGLFAAFPNLLSITGRSWGLNGSTLDMQACGIVPVDPNAFTTSSRTISPV
jgi:hypothetical protein